MNWAEYQELVANAFRRLGAEADVEARVAGARGEHDVDVWVRFTKFGVTVRWLVECKAWKSSVPKEKVVALYAIAQDIGADRAFLFSESGFQAGAIKASENTNVSLTNLAEFEANAEREFYEIMTVKMIQETEKLHARIKPLWIDETGRPSPAPGLDFDELIGLDGAVLFFKLALQKALTDEYPITYSEIADGRRVVSNDAPSFLKNAGLSIATVRASVERFAPAYARIVGTPQDRVRALALAAEQLLATGELCLLVEYGSEDEHDKIRFEAVGKMKAVARAASSLHAVGDDELTAKVRSLIKFLVDTVYLYLAQPKVPRDRWDAAADSVKALVREIEAAAQGR